MSTSETQSNLTAKLGPVLFLLAMLLAPLIGGNPAGEQFGGDAALHALRFLMLLAATLTGIPSLLKGTWPARAADWLNVRGFLKPAAPAKADESADDGG